VRREMRARRRALSSRDRKAASNRFVSLALRAGLLRPGRRIGLYIAHGAEADPKELLRRAVSIGCAVYLPTITDYRASRMRFAHFDVGTPLERNRYGIPEPDKTRRLFANALHLDVIFVPLVAVDSHGNRIGSGAGFYDRALKHLHSARRWRRPKLVGVAFECQKLPHIPSHTWDIPLDALITEKTFYRFKPQTR
jgi:5-formyltetrahydrofolate cyclo-ligase